MTTGHDSRYSAEELKVIVKKLATLMGGDVGCESSVGWGSTFWATLSISRSEVPLIAVHKTAIDLSLVILQLWDRCRPTPMTKAAIVG